MLQQTIPQNDLKTLFKEILSIVVISPTGIALDCDDGECPMYHKYAKDTGEFTDSYLILQLLLSVNSVIAKPLPKQRVKALLDDRITAGIVGTAVMVMTENMEQQQKNTETVVQNALSEDDATFWKGTKNYLPPLS